MTQSCIAALKLSATALFASAFAASLFFNGQRAEYFALAMALLTLWAVTLAWHGLTHVRPARSAILLALAGFQSWLLLTLLWNPAPYLGAGYFWLLGCALLICLAWASAPAEQGLWHVLRPVMLILGMALCITALYQAFVLGEEPKATFINRNSLAVVLNLMTLTAASALLSGWPERRGGRLLLYACIVVMSMVVGLIGSRAAFLGLSGGLALLFALSWQLGAWRKVALIACCAGLGVGLATNSAQWSGKVATALSADRLASLGNPYSAGQDRFIIWTRSLDMAMERPFSGYGLGSYWQWWPQWRHPADASGGFWAHNDLLHLWVEAGAPAVALLLLVHLAVLLTAWRLLRHATLNRERKLEVAGLLAALGSVAIHAQFTFAYYTLPILMLLALLIARINRLYQDTAGQSTATTAQAPAHPATRWLVLALGMVMIGHFALTGYASALYQRATAALQDNRIAEADTLLTRAQTLWSSTDLFYYTHAWLKMLQMQQTPPARQEERLALYRDADALLERAIANNPLRPMPYDIRGRLLIVAADLAGEDWLARAEAAFTESIRRDPRYLDGRNALARILAATGRHTEALAILEDGAAHWYADEPQTRLYRQLLEQARTQTAPTPAQ